MIDPARVSAVLSRGRAAAEARMVDTCRITRSAADVGDRELDDDTLEYIADDPVVVYEGRCRMPRAAAASAQPASSGEASWDVGEYPLSIPMTGPGYTDGETVRVGCTVTYLTSPRDPRLPGHVYGVTGVSTQTDATERRFRMKEVVGA